jgi:predicted permease
MGWTTRIKNLFRRESVEADISEELRSHIEMAVEDAMRAGMTEADARRAARLRFGNPVVLREQTARADTALGLDGLWRDLKLTLRQMRRTPAFAATVLLTLAIGIGANTAVFTVIDRVLLRPLPYPQSDRLVALWLNAPGAGGLANFSSGLRLSASMYLTFSRHNQSFQSMGIWAPGTANVTGVSRPEQVHTAQVSGGLLETLDVPPAVGRWFSPADQDPRGARTVMLSYGFWQRHFGGDRNVVGRMLDVDAQPRLIVGVMPRGFRISDHDFDLLIPMALDPVKEILAGFGYDGIARLKPGVSLTQADADIARLIPVWMDSWSNGPGTDPHYYRIWRIAPHFLSLRDQVVGSVSRMLWVVMATLGVVMLIACANIANLLLVRAESRQQELAVRAALGATRLRLVRELLMESVSLGVVGGVLAVLVAWAGLRLLVASGPATLPRLTEITLDWRSLLFTLLLSIFCGLLFGAIPAWKYARVSLTTGGASRTVSASRSRLRSRNALVVAQTAMALVLLICAILMIRTFAALRHVDPGFSDPAHVQTLTIAIPEQLIGDATMVTRTQNEIADQLAAVPGVTAVGFASSVPMDNDDPNWDEIGVEGKVYPNGEPPLRLFNYVSPGYFHSMGTRLVAGRDFSWADIYGLLPRVMVSENFARDSWGSAAAAVGRRVRQFSGSPWVEVIGVVEDVRVHGVDEVAPMTIYWPAMLYSPYTRKPTIYGPRAVTYAVRSIRAGNPGFTGQLEKAVWSVNGNLPLAQVETMQEIYDASLGRTSFTLVMLAIAGSMAMALSMIGIYGVIAYAVSQRTREMGIRLALGAQRSRVSWMFVRSALLMTGAGVVMGAGAAAALTRLMQSLLFGISPLDPLTYATVPLVLVGVALLASYLPSRRAAAVDPMQALRSE